MTAMAIRWENHHRQKERFTVASTPSKDPRKKLDYTAISTFNDRTLGTVRQTCDYDDHDNPLSCELQVIDESVQPPLTRHYTIKTVSIITEPSASAGTARTFCARPDTGAGTGTCGWCCGTRR